MAFLDSKIDEEIFGSDYETLIDDFYTLIGCSSGGLTTRRIYHMKTSLFVDALSMPPLWPSLSAEFIPKTRPRVQWTVVFHGQLEHRTTLCYSVTTDGH